MTDNSLKADNDAKRIRHHSNTISGSRPPALDIAITRPTHVRRNSEGSPGVPPPICVSEPTPIEPSDELFDFEQKNRPPTPNNDQAKKDSLSDSTPQQSKRSRSRASSLTTSLINEIKESTTIQSLAHKIKSRHGSEDVDNESTVESTTTTAPATSIMTNSTVILANAKRNQDFHALFRSVPEEDSLIEDFGCALQKEILLQGRIYLSENHLCFNANIFGWVTNLVIAFADVVDIEKKTTAYFIPNAIQVSTETSKHFFASFLSRDQAYDLMVDIWHTVRPDLAPKDENDIQNEQESSSMDEDDDNSSEYDSDTEDSYSDDLDSEVNAKETQAKVENRSRKVSMAGSLPAFKDVKHTDSASRRRAQSELPRPNFQTMNEKAGNEKKPDEGSPSTKEESKPQVHEKTKCECGQNGNHYPNIVMDQVYNGTLDQLYKLLFDSDFMKDFLVDNQKSLELEMGDWKKTDSGNALSVREYSYIKQLGGAIGPKQTKCYITQELLHHDLDNYVSVLSTTSTPDVPSGSSFTCKTRTCLTYAGKGKVRLTVTVQVEFTKSSWLKSTIEKASIDGQQTYYKDLDAVLRKHLSNTSSDRSGHGKKKRRSKKSRHHKPKQDEAEPEPPKPKGMFDTISHLLSDSLGSFSPNASHLTLLCLIIMACVNVFIARKMAAVERQIDDLVHVNDFEDATTPHLPQGQRGSRYQPEADDLWAWLGSIDPEKSDQRPIAVAQDPEEQEAIWDEAIRFSKAAKERLDKHMVELNEMIQKAESNLESVTRSVNEQRQKMRQQDA